MALDGPVLPTPSWKVVVEVRDSQRLEQTLEQLAQDLHNQEQGKNSRDIVIEPSQVGAQRFYALHDLKSGTVVAHYTFANGYMIMASSRALVMDALQTHASGNSLSHSQAFKALLPKDTNENYSAMAYQNLGPVLTPICCLSSRESQPMQSASLLPMPGRRRFAHGAETAALKRQATAGCSGLIFSLSAPCSIQGTRCPGKP